MRREILFRALILVGILSVELYSGYAVLHPRVSPNYRAYYIDRKTDDWEPPHYSATPEQGIVFARSGWPQFVRNSSGFADPGSDGRWTDADRAQVPTLFMNQSFQGPLCIEMKLQPSPAERGHRIQIALGPEARDLWLSDPAPAEYRVSFDPIQPANALQFRFDGPIPRVEDVTPGIHDSRRLGLQIFTLRILSLSCRQSEYSR